MLLSYSTLREGWALRGLVILMIPSFHIELSSATLPLLISVIFFMFLFFFYIYISQTSGQFFSCWSLFLIFYPSWMFFIGWEIIWALLQFRVWIISVIFNTCQTIQKAHPQCVTPPCDRSLAPEPHNLLLNSLKKK